MPFSRRRVLQAGLAIGATGVVSALTPELVRGAGRLTAPVRPLDLSVGSVVATFDAGSGPQQLGIRDIAGLSPGGPLALAMRSDGSVAMLDTLNRRISIIRGSVVTSTIPLPHAVFPTDVRERGADLCVLDQAGSQLLVVSGTDVSAFPLPSDRRSRVSRLVAGQSVGAIGVAEEDALSFDYSFDPNAPQPTAQRGFGDGQGGRIVVQYPKNQKNRKTATLVTSSGREIEIETESALGSAVVLGSDRAGFIYVEIAALLESDGGVDVDITIRRYALDGTFAGAARVPVRGRWAQPTTAVAVAPNGDAYAIASDHTRTYLLRLNWTQSLAPLQPLRALLPASFGSANALSVIPNTRQQALNKASNYENWAWTLTAEMMTRSCYEPGSGTYSGLPSYLSAPGTYYHMPYCWGAFDEPGAYVLRISAPYNYTTGDNHGIVGVPWRGCTAGADCSGFIQQCWGIGPPKQSTESILEWVTNSPGQSQDVGGTLYPGDMWRLPNSHVRMHYSYPGDGTGDYMYEASIEWGEQVWFAFRPWSQYTNYLWCTGNFLS